MRSLEAAEDVHFEERADLINLLKQVNVSAFVTRWGPLHVLQVCRPEIDLHGILIIDNIALGPGCGPIEIEPVINPHAQHQKARKMTWTCALSDTNLGGASAAIRATPSCSSQSELIRRFAREVSPYVPDRYIAAPARDLGEKEMAAFADEIGDQRGATGKPPEMGGVPHRTGMESLGIGSSIESFLETAESRFNLPDNISEATVAIAGYDEVGASLARYLLRKGAKVVAVSDDSAGMIAKNGLDVKRIRSTNNHLSESRAYGKVSRQDVLAATCDVLVCNARDHIVESVANDIRAKVIVEARSNSIDTMCEQSLLGRGVPVIPDIVANVGLAIASYAEYQQDDCSIVFKSVERKAKELTQTVMSKSMISGIAPRRIAEEIAMEKILRAMEDSDEYQQ